MKLGIVGLPNVGKSTIFNAITSAGAESANYPFCTIEPNVGVVSVSDERLDVLTKMHNSKKTVPAIIEFVDIAGLVKGASKGEGLGNKFLSHIREVDAIVHVVRCFEDTNIIHVDGSIDPIRDIETINLELIFADIETLNKKLAKTAKLLKSDKKAQKQVDFIEKLIAHLEDGNGARTFEFSEDDLEVLADTNLLTIKPIIYAANFNEEDFKGEINDNENYKKVIEFAKSEGAGVIPICGKIEEDLASLEDEEKEMFLADLNLESSGLDRLVNASYTLLGLISYLTTGEDETRAWTIKKGTKAPGAAGKIHTDFERGFIRAEVVAYKDLVECGNMVAAKEKGLVRSEGKEYVVNDGDVILFRFNV